VHDESVALREGNWWLMKVIVTPVTPLMGSQMAACGLG
jgi:hypothetical protein